MPGAAIVSQFLSGWGAVTTRAFDETLTELGLYGGPAALRGPFEGREQAAVRIYLFDFVTEFTEALTFTADFQAPLSFTPSFEVE